MKLITSVRAELVEAWTAALRLGSGRTVAICFLTGLITAEEQSVALYTMSMCYGDACFNSYRAIIMPLPVVSEDNTLASHRPDTAFCPGYRTIQFVSHCAADSSTACSLTTLP